MIDEKTCHDVVAKTVWISRIVNVRLELSRPSVKTEQPVVISSSPEIAGMVFANRDHIGTDRWSASPAVRSVVPGLAVDGVECLGRADPHDSLTILVDCANKGLGRTLRTDEMRNSLKRQRVRRKMDHPHPTQPSPDASFPICE